MNVKKALKDIEAINAESLRIEAAAKAGKADPVRDGASLKAGGKRLREISREISTRFSARALLKDGKPTPRPLRQKK